MFQETNLTGMQGGLEGEEPACRETRKTVSVIWM